MVMCKTCKVEGCEKEVFAKEYCSKHYTQFRKYGHILKYSCHDKTNHIEKFEDHAEIYLINIKNEVVGKALIDLEDIDKVKDFKWCMHSERNGTYTYVTTSNKNCKYTKLHRLIMNASKNEVVDHINRNQLDNRKCNLRLCSNQENLQNCNISKNNTSKCKGVYWAKDKNKWTVQVSYNGKTKYIGRYNSYEDAVKARIEAAKKYYGDFANDEKCLSY